MTGERQYILGSLMSSDSVRPNILDSNFLVGEIELTGLAVLKGGSGRSVVSRGGGKGESSLLRSNLILDTST